MTLPSPSYQGTQEGEPSVEGLMTLVEEYGFQRARAVRADAAGATFSLSNAFKAIGEKRDAIRSYAERLSRPHSETQQPSDGGKA